MSTRRSSGGRSRCTRPASSIRSITRVSLLLLNRIRPASSFIRSVLCLIEVDEGVVPAQRDLALRRAIGRRFNAFSRRWRRSAAGSGSGRLAGPAPCAHAGPDPSRDDASARPARVWGDAPGLPHLPRGGHLRIAPALRRSPRPPAWDPPRARCRAADRTGKRQRHVKVVADTNALVSTLIFPGGSPEAVYRLVPRTAHRARFLTAVARRARPPSNGQVRLESTARRRPHSWQLYRRNEDRDRISLVRRELLGSAGKIGLRLRAVKALLWLGQHWACHADTSSRPR